MTRKPNKVSLWTRIQRWFMQFDMCQCIEPKYQILKGVLCCGLCEKAVRWDEQPQEATTKETT